MALEDRMDEYLESLEGDFVIAIEAKRFADLMDEQDPQMLGDWLWEHAEQFIAYRMGGRIRSARARRMARAAAHDFSEAAKTGNVERFIGMFADSFVIDEQQTRRKVSDMTGADHFYVADAYRATGNRDLLLAECHRRVAMRVGDRRTCEAMTEQEYEQIFGSALDAPTDQGEAA